MLELSIDNKNKRIHALVELKGEEKPIAIDVQYELIIEKETNPFCSAASSLLITVSAERGTAAPVIIL